jgi:hypothetical protein
MSLSLKSALRQIAAGVGGSCEEKGDTQHLHWVWRKGDISHCQGAAKQQQNQLYYHVRNGFLDRRRSTYLLARRGGLRQGLPGLRLVPRHGHAGDGGLWKGSARFLCSMAFKGQDGRYLHCLGSGGQTAGVAASARPGRPVEGCRWQRAPRARSAIFYPRYIQDNKLGTYLVCPGVGRHYHPRIRLVLGRRHRHAARNGGLPTQRWSASLSLFLFQP